MSADCADESVFPAVEEALSASAVIEEEYGRYVVYLDVVLVSGGVRHRISDYPTRAKAETAAHWIVRQAGAVRPDPTGF